MRDKIIKEARSWLGTPFVHQGRLKGIGVDCAGLIEQVAFALNLTPADYKPILNYPKDPSNTMQEWLDKYLVKISFRNITQGSILFFKVSPRALHGQHLAFYTKENTIIHAHTLKGKVIETTFSGVWAERLLATYDFKGLN